MFSNNFSWSYLACNLVGSWHELHFTVFWLNSPSDLLRYLRTTQKGCKQIFPVSEGGAICSPSSISHKLNSSTIFCSNFLLSFRALSMIVARIKKKHYMLEIWKAAFATGWLLSICCMYTFLQAHTCFAWNHLDRLHILHSCLSSWFRLKPQQYLVRLTDIENCALLIFKIGAVDCSVVILGSSLICSAISQLPMSCVTRLWSGTHPFLLIDFAPAASTFSLLSLVNDVFGIWIR